MPQKQKRPVSMWSALVSKRMWLSFLMGLSSGLPLVTTGSTLQAWMTDAGVDLKVIGVFSLVGLPYTVKFLWSPFLDRFSFGRWGRRRGWMMLSQLGLVASLWALSYLDPKSQLAGVAVCALVISFLSATQDILIDAYRRENLPERELGLGASFYVNGYRIAMLISGAFALFMADRMPWPEVYRILGGCMAIGLVATAWADESKSSSSMRPPSLRSAVFDPFLEYFKRPSAWWVLGFILLYKVGDNMAAQMTTPFLLNLGFTKTAIAAVAKTFGMAATMLGGLLGGIWLMRLGTMRALYIFGVLQMLSTFAFSALVMTGPESVALAAVMSLENLSGGMGTAAFLAFMASMTNTQFTATQYALFSSLMGVPRVIVAAPTGWMADQMGWMVFFIFCGVSALPGLWVLARMSRKSWFKI